MITGKSTGYGKEAYNTGNIPKTGDATQVGLYGLLASFSAGVLLLLGKKRKKEEEK